MCIYIFFSYKNGNILLYKPLPFLTLALTRENIEPFFSVLVTIYLHHHLEWLQRFAGRIGCVLIFCYNKQYSDEHLCTYDWALA